MGPGGPSHPWTRSTTTPVGAALQAEGLVAGDHVAILGPTSRELMTIVRGCWMAGIASMVLPLPMRMGSLEAFIRGRARIRHGDAKLVLIDDGWRRSTSRCPGTRRSSRWRPCSPAPGVRRARRSTPPQIPSGW